MTDGSVETSEPVALVTADGWRIGGEVTWPARPGRGGVVLVPASKHERDAYGRTLPRLLTDQGLAVLAIDIRGRGESRDPRPFTALPPRRWRDVALDVGAAIEYFAGDGRSGAAIAVVSEQDSCRAALAAAQSGAVAAHVLISGHIPAPPATVPPDLPVLCVVTTEDRAALRAMTDIYTASTDDRSRMRVFDGLGFGTTMFSAWQFAYPSEPSIEAMIAEWFATVLL